MGCDDDRSHCVFPPSFQFQSHVQTIYNLTLSRTALTVYPAADYTDWLQIIEPETELPRFNKSRLCIVMLKLITTGSSLKFFSKHHSGLL